MRIAHAARRLGVSAAWIRAVERAGRIPRIARDTAGQRRFTDDDLERLRRLRMDGDPADEKETES